MTDPQPILDTEHLRLLALGYRISAGLSAFFSLFGLLYVGFGIMLVSVIPTFPHSAATPPPPAFFGWIMAGFGCAFTLLSLTLAFLKFWTARCLDRRQSRTFCQVVAVVCCLGIPYGTILGAFTFIALSRPSVRELFEGKQE